MEGQYAALERDGWCIKQEVAFLLKLTLLLHQYARVSSHQLIQSRMLRQVQAKHFGEAQEHNVSVQKLLLDTDLRKVHCRCNHQRNDNMKLVLIFHVQLVFIQIFMSAVSSLKHRLNGACLQFGQPWLPDNINHADSLLLKGAHVLQTVSLEDVSKPSQGVGTSSHRCSISCI